MKKDPNATANASAVTTAIVYVVCRFSFVLFPEISMIIGKSWFHGIDISLIAAQDLTIGSSVLGLTTATIGAWLVGYIFARMYNSFLTK